MARNRKYISYCLYGDNPLYSEGLIENLTLSQELYPTWQPIVYLDSRKYPELGPLLESNGAHVVSVFVSNLSDRQLLIQGMFWRLKALELPDASHIIFRDCDSRISMRERVAVEAWLASDTDFHFMYDHPYHTVPILGGMWGCRGGLVDRTELAIDEFHQRFMEADPYWPQCDQSFLREYIWSKFAKHGTYLAHGLQELSEFYAQNDIKAVPFPTAPDASRDLDFHGGYVGKMIVTRNSQVKAQKK